MSIVIEMPKLSDTMSVGTVVKWYKSVGESVVNGDILAEIETDKATMELENFDDGVLLKLLAVEGDEVEIGKPLAVIGEPGEDVSHFDTKGEKSADPTPEKSTPIPADDSIESQAKITAVEPSEEIKVGSKNSGRIIASPLAKKIAKEKNIDLSTIHGSGPNGRIVKKDLIPVPDSDSNKPALVTNSVASRTPVAHAGDKSVPVSKMRSVIARRLLESKTTIPHFYLQREINSEPVRVARESINDALSQDSSALNKVSMNDVILLACAKTILRFPEINSSWSEREITFHGNVHLAFGVAVEDGLVTPVIRHAERLDLRSISEIAKTLIVKSRNKKLTPDEMSGSTFTVTNLGMYGIDFFSGIINPPNAVILSVGGSIKKPVVDKNGTLQAGETMTLGLSCDHRLVDGAVGAQFLASLAAVLENPASLLVL
jgi:pyruvate dehydrogenase E2 component (dihydrolipoamide acetyltransferase)